MCFVKPKPFLYQVEKDKTFYPFSKGQQVNTPCPLVLKLMTLETFLKENDGPRYIIHWVKKNSKGEVGSYEKERKETR